MPPGTAPSRSAWVQLNPWRHRRGTASCDAASAGARVVAGTMGSDAFVASYGPTGKLNFGFGTFGVAVANLSSGQDSGDDLVIKPAGDLVLAGTASSTTSRDMALVRFKPGGHIDT